MQHTHQPARRWALTFFPIWTGQALSLLGSQVAQFAIVWWLTATTGSGTVLAIATMVAILPGVLLGPLVGALVDRWNRRMIMIMADTISALAAAVLVYLFWTDSAEVWHLYVISFVRSICATFHFPAMEASTSLMVPHEHLARVAGLNQMLQGAMSIAAPPLGAMLLALMPLHAVMGVDVVTAALAVLPLLFVTTPQPPRAAVAEGQPGPTLVQDMLDGLRYVRGWPGLMIVMVMAMVLNFLINPAFALLPLLVTRHFGGGALELSWMSSSWSVGILVGGVLLSTWGGFRSRMLTTLVGVIAQGAGLVLLALTPPQAFWLGVGALLFAGVMNAFCNGPLFAMLQSVVAPEMQGRIFTLLGSLASLMAPLGLAIAGPLSDLVGPQPWFGVGGAACIVLGIVAFGMPSVMNIERQAAAAPAPSSATEPAA